MSPRDVDQPSWPEILQATQDQLAARIHTALPGRIRSYDVATQHADIEVLVQLAGKPIPPLGDVPVCFPGGAAGFLHVPLEVGDSVLVVFVEEDFSGWWDTGSISAPKVLSRHGLHAVAIAGLRRPAAAAPVTGGHVTLAATAMLHLGSDAATAFVALANLVDERIATLQYAFDKHVHATAGTGTPSPPIPDPTAIPLPTVPIGSLASVAATKVRAV